MPGLFQDARPLCLGALLFPLRPSSFLRTLLSPSLSRCELPRVGTNVPRVRRVPSQLDHTKPSCQSELPKPSIDFAQLRQR